MAASMAARQRRKPRRRRGGRGLVGSLLLTVLLGALIAALVFAGAAIGAGAWLDTALRRAPVVTDYPDRPAAGAGTNWLLVGSDSRQDLTAEQQQHLTTGGDLGPGRTDTLLLIHVPQFGLGAPTTVVSVPRDSYVSIPGYGSDKINAAFALGGAPLLAQTVEQATGLRLDHYVEIGFSGFADVVDAVGGVTLCPDEPTVDPLAGLDLPAGCQLMDGRAALGYVRSRATPRADLDRMDNQRAFLSALLDRLTSPAVWANPWRWYAVTRAAAGALTVDSDDRPWDLAMLGWALHGSHDSPVMLTVPIGDFAYSDSGDVVIWDNDAADRLFQTLNSQ